MSTMRFVAATIALCMCFVLMCSSTSAQLSPSRLLRLQQNSRTHQTRILQPATLFQQSNHVTKHAAEAGGTACSSTDGKHGFCVASNSAVAQCHSGNYGDAAACSDGSTTCCFYTSCSSNDGSQKGYCIKSTCSGSTVNGKCSDGTTCCVGFNPGALSDGASTGASGSAATPSANAVAHGGSVDPHDQSATGDSNHGSDTNHIQDSEHSSPASTSGAATPGAATSGASTSGGSNSTLPATVADHEHVADASHLAPLSPTNPPPPLPAKKLYPDHDHVPDASHLAKSGSPTTKPPTP